MDEKLRGARLTISRFLAGCRRAVLPILLATGALGAQAADEFVYTVQAGDHPWNLAQRYLREPADALRLSRLNRIPDDRRIPPGTRLRIPIAWLKLEATGVRVSAVGGELLLLQAGNGAAPRRGAVGELLAVGNVLRTGAQGSATLVFDDGSRVLVHQDTELRLVQAQRRQLAGSRLVELELVRGRLENQVMPAPDAAGRFDIRSPAAVAAVRGTVFRVAAEADHTRTEVLEGSVQVANAAGQALAGAGQGTVVAAGQPPAPPVALPAPPDLSGLPATLERFPMELPFPPVAGAVAWRTQLFAEGHAEVIASDVAADQPRARARSVPDGRYELRVRSIDAQGLEGGSARRAIEVFTRPEPPLLIEPAPGAELLSARPRFRWTEAEARAYRIEIRRAGDSLASTPLQALTVTGVGAATALDDLDSGVYQWRMAAIDTAAANRQGPWGDSQAFRRVLPGPGVQAADVSPDRVVLRWSAQPRTRAYRLQVARDAGFGDLLADVSTPDAQHVLQKLAPGRYQLRVSATAEDGHVGPWGDPQVLTVPEPPPPPPPPEPARWPALLLVLPLLLLGL